MSASQAGHCNMVATDDDLWLCFSPSALEDAGCAINKGEEVDFGRGPNWYLCPACLERWYIGAYAIRGMLLVGSVTGRPSLWLSTRAVYTLGTHS